LMRWRGAVSQVPARSPRTPHFCATSSPDQSAVAFAALVPGAEYHPDWLADFTIHSGCGHGLCFRPHALRRKRRHSHTQDCNINHRRAHVIDHRRVAPINTAQSAFSRQKTIYIGSISISRDRQRSAKKRTSA
jgi:hypothetical protein